MSKKSNKKKSLSVKIKEICSITVKNEGRALNTIFILCLFCIFFFSLYLFRVSTNFYNRLDDTMENNINLNMEMRKNETIHDIDAIIDSIENRRS